MNDERRAGDVSPLMNRNSEQGSGDCLAPAATPGLPTLRVSGRLRDHESTGKMSGATPCGQPFYYSAQPPHRVPRSTHRMSGCNWASGRREPADESGDSRPPLAGSRDERHGASRRWTESREPRMKIAAGGSRRFRNQGTHVPRSPGNFSTAAGRESRGR